MRNINNKPYKFYTEPLLKSSRILTIDDQFKFNSNVLMYQYKNEMLPSSFNKLKYFDKTNRRHTRQIDLANCKTPRTTFTSVLPYHQLPRLWNELDSQIRNITKITGFKRVLKNRMLDSYAERVHCTNDHCRQCYPQNL